ncbi:MAG TPA: MaoC family dehydratase [Acidimicrobiales bacterium]|nr:MaoC family dehydratase [Acidimicrobiales bacterium]
MDVAVGDEIPAWVVAAVSVEKMKIFSALIRDPNPIHIDAAAVQRLGLGDREINQGPISMGYLYNMLGDWLGGVHHVTRLSVRFGANVYAGDEVVATGTVTAVEDLGGRRVATCDVRLEVVGGATAMTGSAVVTLP